MWVLDDGFGTKIVKIKGKWRFSEDGERAEFSTYQAANKARMEIYRSNPIRGALVEIIRI